MDWEFFPSNDNDDWRIAGPGTQQDDEAVRLLLESWRSDDDAEDAQDMLDENVGVSFPSTAMDDLMGAADDGQDPVGTTTALEEEMLFETASLLLHVEDGDHLLLQSDNHDIDFMPAHLISEAEDEDSSYNSEAEKSLDETMQERYQRALCSLAESVQRSVMSRNKILAAKGDDVHQIFTSMQLSTKQLQAHLQKLQTSIPALEQRRSS